MLTFCHWVIRCLLCYETFHYQIYQFTKSARNLFVSFRNCIFHLSFYINISSWRTSYYCSILFSADMYTILSLGFKITAVFDNFVSTFVVNIICTSFIIFSIFIFNVSLSHLQ
ncbi:unnamed protein product [Chilo suppressalis]|uniref:Uncharacterized protein n=1 Tax=Chilo suppressalis TaxID=168631 RepID=A0ABN8BBD8_CHISP|nr:unnamed protein product [Chilo suppressalis]